MKATSWINLFVCLLSLATSVAPTGEVAPAEDYVNENSETINKYYEYLKGLGLDKLCSFMRASQVDRIINTLGPFTLFGPTDAALDLIPLEFLKLIRNDQALLEEFILGHIMNNFIALHGIANEAVLPCINGAPIRFNVYRGGEVRTVSGAQITNPGQRFGNMLVYVVDRVVYPIPGIDIFNYTRERYSYFNELLKLADISLLPGRTYTLFAPLTESFENLPKTALDLLYENRTLLKDVLLNHLVQNTYFTAGLTDENTVLKTVGGGTITTTSRRGLILANGVPLVKPDIHLSNGVLHGITRVILPHTFLEICKCIPISTNHQRYLSQRGPAAIPKPVPQIIPRYGARIGPVPSGFLFISPPVSQPVTAITPTKTVLQVIQTPLLITGHRTATLTIAADLFKRAGLLDTLAKTNPLTTVLPTDEAFSNLPNGTLELLKSDVQSLKELLLCHMIAQNILPAELQSNIRLPTYGGVSLNVKIIKRKLLLIGGCQVVAVSRVTTGIVYIVDRVLYPRPVPTLLAALEAQPSASKFLELLLKAKLDALLTGQTSSTCFVPTNFAFSLLPSEFTQKLLTDPFLLRVFILHHCVSGLHFSKEFTDYLTLLSHLREDLNFEIKSDGIYVNGAKIILPDICAGNGVVHLIDSILKPSQIPEDTLDNVPEVPVTVGCTTREEVTMPVHATEFEITEEQTTLGVTMESGTEITTEEQTTLGVTTESGTEITTEKQTTVDMTTETATEEQTTVDIITETATEEQTTADMTTETATEEQTTVDMITESDTEDTTEVKTTEEQTTIAMTTGDDTEPTTEAETTEEETTVEVTTESETETTTEVTTPMPSLLEAVEGEGFDIFLQWLNKSGYLDSIQDGGEYTIFVPTDDAINDLPPTLRNVIEKQDRKLKKTLKHHIVPSSLELDQIPNETTVPTLLPKKDIRINKYGDLITASGAPTGKRIKVGNIQFVTIDRVLEPPTSDLYAAVSKSSMLKKTAKLIEVAGLTDELKNGGPYTFYAPSKKAYKKMPPEEYNRLLMDPSAAKEFVLRHLVRAAQYTSGMTDDSLATTENGNILNFQTMSDPMMVNSANINFSDINATNGVLHIIDDIL